MRISVFIAGLWLYLLFILGMSCLIRDGGFSLWTVGHMKCFGTLLLSLTAMTIWAGTIIIAGVNLCVGKPMTKHLAATWIYIQICIISGLSIGHNVDGRIQAGLAVFVGGFVVYALLRMTWWSLKTVFSRPQLSQSK